MSDYDSIKEYQEVLQRINTQEEYDSALENLQKRDQLHSLWKTRFFLKFPNSIVRQSGNFFIFICNENSSEESDYYPEEWEKKSIEIENGLLPIDKITKQLFDNWDEYFIREIRRMWRDGKRESIRKHIKERKDKWKLKK